MTFPKKLRELKAETTTFPAKPYSHYRLQDFLVTHADDIAELANAAEIARNCLARIPDPDEAETMVINLLNKTVAKLNKGVQ
jgi:hypothetical protein